MKQTLIQRISKLEVQVQSLNELYNSKLKEVERPAQPYTAMRSTGIKCDKCPHEYCECSSGRYKDNNTCAECGKPIKPQEDIRENIGKIINEYWGNGYQIGKHGAFSAKTMETYTVVDRILAIVKGE